VSSQPQEDRLTKLVLVRPLGKFDLGDSTGLTYWQRFMTAEVIPWPQAPRLFSGRFIKGQLARLELTCQKFSR
jgi:hypothetical protein